MTYLYMSKRRKTIFHMAAAAMLNCQKLLFWSCKPRLHVIMDHLKVFFWLFV